MLDKKHLPIFLLTLISNSLYSASSVIPKAVQDLEIMTRNQSSYVLKNAKGTILQPSLTQTTPENWFNLSPVHGVEGVRSEETYVEFGLPQGAAIIVAVVDSGVDVNHEDLQGKIWINEDEIPNNGLDDDNNGYVDDVFGWNFIGGAQGMARVEQHPSLKNGLRLIKGSTEYQVNDDTLEVTRELVRLKKLKQRVEELGEELTPTQAAYLEKLTKEVSDSFNEAQKNLEVFQARLEVYNKSAEILKAAGLELITLESVRTFESTDEAVLKAKADMISLLSNGQTEARIKRVIARSTGAVKYHFNESFDPRPIVGDNYTDLNEKFYGNNDVIGPDSSHGTHVAGIIAALRDNSKGIKGVATNVKIMAVRVIPNGDERDKDVANSIRYAVDNGAKIINMSFGKAYSPQKRVVDEAMKYAEEKGVLLVHAAGNSNQDNDFEPNFPNRFNRAGKKEFSNWLEIGASSFKKGLSLPARFSNFGKRTVDLFAPGVDILSTTPDDKYDVFSGTSMASPAAAGVAALALSYDESLATFQLKSLLLDTSRRFPNLKVNRPGTQDEVLFSSLSTTGSVIDSFETIKNLR